MIHEDTDSSIVVIKCSGCNAQKNWKCKKHEIWSEKLFYICKENIVKKNENYDEVYLEDIDFFKLK